MHGVDEKKALSRVGYTEIVKAAAKDLIDRNDTHGRLVYSICSGMAHGDLWPTLNATDRVELPGAPEGVAHLHIKASVPILLYTTSLATDMVERAWFLYDQRRRSPYRR